MSFLNMVSVANSWMFNRTCFTVSTGYWLYVSKLWWLSGISYLRPFCVVLYLFLQLDSWENRKYGTRRGCKNSHHFYSASTCSAHWSPLWHFGGMFVVVCDYVRGRSWPCSWLFVTMFVTVRGFVCPSSLSSSMQFSAAQSFKWSIKCYFQWTVIIIYVCTN